MNKDVKRRDEIIFGKYDETKYSGGLRSFTCTREVIEKLIEEDFIDLEECQNYSPTTQEFMDMTDPESGVTNVEFQCYAISPDRNDYRVTIEGVDVEIQDNDFDSLTNVINAFRSADEFNIGHYAPSFFVHAWWD